MFQSLLFCLAAALDLQHTIHFVMESAAVRGMAVAMDGPHGVRVQGYGARGDGNARVDADTVFAVGSLTKTFTAALALRDAAQGHLSLDAPAGKYVTGLSPAASVPTVEQLLDDRSGIPTYGAQQDPYDVLANAPAAFAPGERFDYSNTNYVLLGLIEERVVPGSYAAQIAAAFTQPLQLHDTLPWPVAERNVATGYAGGAPVAALPFTRTFAAAGLGSSAHDMLRWMRAVRAGSVLPWRFRETLFDETVAGDTIRYRDGFFFTRWNGTPVWYVTGFVPGFSSIALSAPSRGIDIVVLCNGDAVDLLPLARSILAYQSQR